MKRALTPILALGTAGVLMMTQGAWAHPGHGSTGLTSGILHPLTGVDHLAAMFAVGLWATQLGKKALWMVPAGFVGMMLVGAALALSGVTIPFVEQGIAASVLVLGLLIASGFRMPASAGMLLVGAFAIFHGWAHGSEMASGTSAAMFGAGFLLSTVLLHAAGIGTGVLFEKVKGSLWTRAAGVGLMGCGALLVAGVL